MSGATKTRKIPGVGLSFAIGVHVAQLHGLWQHIHVMHSLLHLCDDCVFLF